MEYMKRFRDLLRESTDILDELILLNERSNDWEDNTRERESILERYRLKAMEIQPFNNRCRPPVE